MALVEALVRLEELELLVVVLLDVVVLGESLAEGDDVGLCEGVVPVADDPSCESDPHPTRARTARPAAARVR